jgi:hypothetical protein
VGVYGSVLANLVVELRSVLRRHVAHIGGRCGTPRLVTLRTAAVSRDVREELITGVSMALQARRQPQHDGRHRLGRREDTRYRGGCEDGVSSAHNHRRRGSDTIRRAVQHHHVHVHVCAMHGVPHSLEVRLRRHADKEEVDGTAGSETRDVEREGVLGLQQRTRAAGPRGRGD